MKFLSYTEEKSLSLYKMYKYLYIQINFNPLYCLDNGSLPLLGNDFLYICSIKLERINSIYIELSFIA